MKSISLSSISIVIIALLILTIFPVQSGTSEDLTLSSSSGSSSRGIPETEWPHFRGDAARTGNTTAEGLDYYELGWSVSIGIYWTSAVVQYDQIYVSSTSRLYCYDLDGNQVWTFNAGATYGSPLVYNGRVYYASDGGSLYCLDANATGSGTTTTYWTYTSAGGSHSSPATDGSLVYYTKTHSSGLHAVYINNGTRAWNASIGGATLAESSPAYWNGYVYVGAGESWGSGNNFLYAFYSNNGTLRWKFNAGSVIGATPAVEYGYVYFGGYNGRVFAVDATGTHGSTTKLWEYNTGVTTLGVLSSVAVAYDRVYVGVGNSRMYCLDAYGSSGGTTVDWNPQLTPAGQYGIYSSAAVTSDYVYIGTGGNAFYCLNRATGATKWSNTFPTATYGISSSPAIYKDYVIITSDNGYLYVVKPDTTPPKITGTDPDDNDVDVIESTNISITFDEDMSVFSISTSSITVENSSSGQVTGVVSRDMSTGVYKAFFTPSSPFEKSETYTVTVSTDIMDARGNALDGNGNGVAEGPGVDEYIFSFSTIAHGKPHIADIPNLSMTEDIPYTLDLDIYVSDSDTLKDDLIVTHDSDYGVLTGLELVLEYPDGILTDLINISVSDGLFKVYQEVDVTIMAVNDLPIIAPIPALNLVEDISYDLDMEDYVTDVDTSLVLLKVYDNSQYVTVYGMILNFTYPEGVTKETVTVEVKDAGYPVTTDIEVTIAPVNDPPTIKSISTVNVNEDEEYEISLTKYISDIETDKEDLELVVDSPYVKVKGHVLELLYPEKVSVDYLDVRVFDGELYDNTTLKVMVEPVNDFPEIKSIDSPPAGQTYEYNSSIDLKAMVDDPDLEFGDTLTFNWHSTIDGDLGTTQNVTGIVLSPGLHTLTFTIVDETGDSDTKDISVVIKNKPEDQTPDPSDNDDDPLPSGTGNDDKSSSDEGSSLMLILVIIATVVVILLVVFFMFMRKKKTPQEPPASLEPMMPGTYPQMPGMPGMPGMQYQQPYQAYPDQQMLGQYPPQQYPQGYPQQDLQGYPQQYPEQYPEQYPQQQFADQQFPELPAGEPGPEEHDYFQDFANSPADQTEVTDQPVFSEGTEASNQPQYSESLSHEELFPSDSQTLFDTEPDQDGQVLPLSGDGPEGSGDTGPVKKNQANEQNQ